jgi:hypothetical protein
MYENIIAIHNILKKKNYIVKFSTSSIFKKISKDNFKTNFFLKNNKKKEKKSILAKKKSKKKHVRKTKTKKKNYYSEYPSVLELFNYNYILYI